MKLFPIAFFCLFFNSNAQAQLDSVDFNADFVINPTFTAGLDSIALTQDVLQVRVFLNDQDYVGKLVVLIYNAESNTPVAISKYERNEIIEGNLTENGLIIFNFPFIDPNTSYKIRLEVTNFQGATFAPIIKTIP